MLNHLKPSSTFQRVVPPSSMHPSQCDHASLGKLVIFDYSYPCLCVCTHVYVCMVPSLYSLKIEQLKLFLALCKPLTNNQKKKECRVTRPCFLSPGISLLVILS